MNEIGFPQAHFSTDNLISDQLYVFQLFYMPVILQVYGRLPFDDSDHKKLIKQAVSGVIFPKKPEISEKCQNLIQKLLLRASDRILMRSIKSDPWYKKQKMKADEKADEKQKAEMKEAEETIISDTPISIEPAEADELAKVSGEKKTEDGKHEQVEKETTYFKSFGM